MIKPNTFLVGAPKCGTTSIAQWLREHDEVFFSEPKEPYFFCRPSLQIANIRSLKDYEALFSKVAGQKIVAEGTTASMYDKTSIPKIFCYNPESSLVVMLRNPLEQAISWYGENVKQGREEITDFYKAWCESDTRKTDSLNRINNIDPILLNYKAICSLGSQLQNVYKYYDNNKVHVILFDDLVTNPKEVWMNLLKFLKISDDNRSSFKAENIGFVPKNIKSYRQLRASASYIKNLIGFKGGTGFMNKIFKLYKREEDKSVDLLTIKQKDIIMDYLNHEISLLEKLLERDLSHWR